MFLKSKWVIFQKKTLEKDCYDFQKFMEKGYGYGSIKILIPKEIDSNDDKAEGDENDKLKWYQYELNLIEAEKRDGEETEAFLKLMWLDWTIERIQDVEIKKVEPYWLEPNSSYLIKNLTNSLLDFRMCERAFLFRCFNYIASIPLCNSEENKKIFPFCLNHSKPQYEVLPLKRIVVIKKMEKAKIDEFINYIFTILRGDLKEQS